jgi:hypothetical protein
MSNELEGERQKSATQVAELEREEAAAHVFSQVTEEHAMQLLKGIAKDFNYHDRESLKEWLQSIVERVVLDPEKLTCRIHYGIPVQRRDKLASPRGFEPLLPP